MFDTLSLISTMKFDFHLEMLLSYDLSPFLAMLIRS